MTLKCFQWRLSSVENVLLWEAKAFLFRITFCNFLYQSTVKGFHLKPTVKSRYSFLYPELIYLLIEASCFCRVIKENMLLELRGWNQIIAH